MNTMVLVLQILQILARQDDLVLEKGHFYRFLASSFKHFKKKSRLLILVNISTTKFWYCSWDVVKEGNINSAMLDSSQMHGFE